MSKLYVLYFVAYVVCVSVLSRAYTYDPPSPPRALTCQEPQSNSINWLADFSNKYKTITICDFQADTKAVIDSEGRWIVSFRANTILKSDSETEQLCECMRKFLFQSDWSEGATYICKPECNSLTIFVIGARNPSFIGLKSVTDTCEPVKVLGSGLDKHSDIQLGGKNCITKTGRTSTGQFRILSECDNDPQPEKICSIMYDYLNTDNWLGTTTTHECFVKNNKLYLEIVEKITQGYCY